ncbi:hypothetical protein HY251_19200 [bacterium]|nr:hypothetical protein [bacterium]
MSMSTRVLALLCASFFSLAIVFAQGKEEKKPEPTQPENAELPFRPFENAKPGDWECLLVTEHASPEETPERSLETYRIASVTSSLVTVSTETRTVRGTTKKPQDDAFASSGSKLADLLALWTSEPLSGLKVESEKKTVGARALACSKVTFIVVRSRPVAPGMIAVASTSSYVLWLSRDVPGAGVVAMTVAVKAGGGGTATTSEHELVGFGNGDRAEWGQKPDEVALEGSPPKEQTRKPDGQGGSTEPRK